MTISARIESGFQQHHITLQTNSATQNILLPVKDNGYGSAANGGELLCLALATCYCNDIYREAARKNLRVDQLEVSVTSNFEKEGVGASEISYQVRIRTSGTEEETRELACYTDTVAEIQNTIRTLSDVMLSSIEIL